MNISTTYIGRFAPSPSGPLHFGSLVAALGSYLQAKAQGGQWLVRMEDIDPPREMPGAADQILRTLEAHGLCWDKDVLWQSRRSDYYDELLEQLLRSGHCYWCECTRKAWQNCNKSAPEPCPCWPEKRATGAIRFCPESGFASFNDVIQGNITLHSEQAEEPFVVKRRDGLYAYQLAVVADDWAQGVTEIIRGADLLDTTPWQRSLFQALGADSPRFGHLPVASNSPGQKLSKQNHAEPLDNTNTLKNLQQALAFLQFTLSSDSRDLTQSELLQWAVSRWRPEQVRGLREILV